MCKYKVWSRLEITFDCKYMTLKDKTQQSGFFLFQAQLFLLKTIKSLNWMTLIEYLAGGLSVQEAAHASIKIEQEHNVAHVLCSWKPIPATPWQWESTLLSLSQMFTLSLFLRSCAVGSQCNFPSACDVINTQYAVCEHSQENESSWWWEVDTGGGVSMWAPTSFFDISSASPLPVWSAQQWVLKQPPLCRTGLLLWHPAGVLSLHSTPMVSFDVWRFDVWTLICIALVFSLASLVHWLFP